MIRIEIRACPRLGVKLTNAKRILLIGALSKDEEQDVIDLVDNTLESV